MTKEEVEKSVEAALEQRKTKVLNRNALKALFGAFSDPVGALGQVFMGRAEAVDAARQRLEQGAIIELLCKIDEAISHAVSTLKSGDASGIVVQGLIETHGADSANVIGVHVTPDAGQVEFAPGTRIRTTGSGVGNLTGLKIGGKKENG